MSLDTYLDLRFQRTEASLRKVRFDMSSHFSNLGGLTWAIWSLFTVFFYGEKKVTQLIYSSIN